MYKLYKISDELYQIHSSWSHEKAMEGTLAGIIVYCVKKLGFNVDDLQAGFIDMIHEETDTAEFNVRRKFVRSFNRKQRKAG